MKKAILFSALIAFAYAKPDPFEDFLKQLEVKVQQTNFAACNKLSHDQSRAGSSVPEEEVVTLDSCMKYSQQLSVQLLSDFRPIALKEIEKASSNIDGKYYKLDLNTDRWHLPNQPAPASPVDGVAENAKILTAAFDFQFKQLLKTSDANGLQKRWGFLRMFPRFGNTNRNPVLKI